MSTQEIQKLQAQVNAFYEGLSFILSRIDEIEKAAAGLEPTWDPAKIKWEQDEGARGPYERADPQGLMNPPSDFHLMLNDLKAHKGRLTRDGYFYWVFEDQARVGRKKRK